MKKDLVTLPVVLKNLGYADWFFLKLMSDNFKEIRFGQICHYMSDEMQGKKKKEEKIAVLLVEAERPHPRHGIVNVCRNEATPMDYVALRDMLNDVQTAC